MPLIWLQLLVGLVLYAVIVLTITVCILVVAFFRAIDKFMEELASDYIHWREMRDDYLRMKNK